MEVTRVASTSRGTAALTHRPPSHAADTAGDPPAKRRKPDVVAPSSPSKARTLLHDKYYGRAGSSIATNIEEQERIQAELLAFAEKRARASASHPPPPPRPSEEEFRYPPGHDEVDDRSARGLLEQIRNRVAQPKSSSFLQRAKEVQQALLDKQRRSVDLQKHREQASHRESLRSSGFNDDKSSRAGQPSGAAFARGTQRVARATSDVDSDDGDAGYDEHALSETRVSRDDDLALVENLRPGPRPIPPNPDDPKWEAMEPFSGHRLRERRIAHSHLKEHLRGRYHIPPSLLYSIARPLPAFAASCGERNDWKAARDGDYEVPVDGDWIVIATIVEKSDLLMTRGFDPGSAAPRHGATDENDDDPVLFKDAATGSNGRLRLDLEPGNPNAFAEPAAPASTKPWQRRKGGTVQIEDDFEGRREQYRVSNRSRKFVVLKLVDLGVDRAQAADGSGSAGRGDNYLSLIAYEADQVDTSATGTARSEVADVLSASSAARKWVHGSRGAFELLYQLAEGTVVAIMNPKVLRPYRAKGVAETKTLRITPRSAEDCLVIGQAADYRRCSAIRANGQRCTSFVDVKARKQTRTTTCDYHLSRHMDELARGRPEFAANATTRFGNARSGAKPAGSASGGSDLGRQEGETAYSGPGSSQFARAALAKKLNSSYGSVGDGMDNNGGQVFVSQPVGGAEARASNPASWKYDVAERYGRGVTEKQTRIKKQIEEQQLMHEIETRFAPRPVRPRRSAEDGEAQGKDKAREESVLPVLPNGSADMIAAAYSTLDERKRTAAQKRQIADAKRRKYTGTSLPVVATETPEPRLRFAKTPSTSSASAVFPLSQSQRESSRASGKDSRTTLLSLLKHQPPAAAEPNLKLKRAHRPKLRRPAHEPDAKPQLTVVAGELFHLQDLNDWQDDLDDLVVPHPTQKLSPAEHSDDSDLEII